MLSYLFYYVVLNGQHGKTNLDNFHNQVSIILMLTLKLYTSILKRTAVLSKKIWSFMVNLLEVVLLCLCFPFSLTKGFVPG